MGAAVACGQGERCLGSAPWLGGTSMRIVSAVLLALALIAPARIDGTLLLAPARPAGIQALRLGVAIP